MSHLKIIPPLIIFVLATFLSATKIGFSQPTTERYYVFDLAYNHSGTQIAIARGIPICNPDSSDGFAIDILDANQGQLLKSLKGHKCMPNSISWSPDDTTLVSSSGDGSIRFWDVATGQEIGLYGAPQYVDAVDLFEDVIWSPNANFVAVNVGDSLLIDSTNTAIISSINDNTVNTALDLNVTGDLLAVGSRRGDVRIFNISNTSFPELVRTFDSGPVWSISWSPDENHLALTGDVEVRIFDATGTLERTLSGHIPNTQVVAWSPDGSKIATAGLDNTVKIWDAATGELLSTLIYSNANGVIALDWNPDSQTLVYGGNGYDPGKLVVACTLDLTSVDGCSSQWTVGTE